MSINNVDVMLDYYSEKKKQKNNDADVSVEL